MRWLNKRSVVSFGLVGLIFLLSTVSAFSAYFADRDVFFSSETGVYSDQQAIEDFGNIISKTQTDRITINSAGHLVFHMPEGGVGTSGSGGQILSRLQGKDTYKLEYRVKFAPTSGTYDWTEGGKLPGLGGGKNYTGGGDATNGDGFSVRLMFKPDGHLIPYVYHAGMTETWGDGFGADMNHQPLKDVILSSNTWYTVKILVKINSGSNYDGVLKIYVNDMSTPKFTKTNIKYVTDGTKVDTLHMTAFHGGSDPDRYGPSQDQNIHFDWIKIHSY
ncbi:polysaccharide lyase [Metabacillus arenae]|uniref:Polysaccharide lyase 14 domain-containing protein n=1 Tax=Metabacillus arenae TaxID=2771434 RepID=A0A926NMR1_9BACI|nr:hypothetical protein [Metabacillus arenae]MBD1380661.1 hypothetical protein [Metabacillus arenae]